MGNLANLRDMIFEMDNKACFVERDMILGRLKTEMADYHESDKYALILFKLLDEVSVPIEEDDYFAGRVVEALPPDGLKVCNDLLCAGGHMSPHYEKILNGGLKSIVDDALETAKQKGDAQSAAFAKNVEIVANAVKNYCLRYAKKAEEMGLFQMAAALKTVPYEPAYDFFSALQGIWIMHMIASCYVGSRDYAFGNFDQYMLPFYEKALADGKTEEELTDLLAGFLIKTNEICGRTTWTNDVKPIFSNASNQYLCIGGESPNAFSHVCLKAAERSNLPQPEIVVRLKPDADPAFTDQVFASLEVLTDKMNIYNYDTIISCLMDEGVNPEIAKDFTYSACCNLDLNHRTPRCEYYVPTLPIFLEILHSKTYDSIEEILSDYIEKITLDMDKNSDEWYEYVADHMPQAMVFDVLLYADITKELMYGYDKRRPYCLKDLLMPGIATLGDSLMVLDKLVFQEKRYTYQEFMRILDENYENNEELRLEILSYDRFGNDTENDKYTVMMGNALVDAVKKMKKRDNDYHVAGFYSLHNDNASCADIGATPDGRKAGDPYSENQSPSYGADKNGITALLNSLSKLPFKHAGGGGLNLTFSRKMPADILKALTLSYFQKGGLHVGMSIVDRETFEDAMVHPDKYKSLTVRLYGFSEFFICLPKWQQLAILNRTEYSA